MKRLNKLLQIDSHTLHTLAFRLWAVVAGMGNLVMVPLHLTPVDQGYYYTYGGIIALQVFFELGLNQVLTQFTSHEVAHLDLTNGSQYLQSIHYKRLASLVRTMSRWYTVLAIGFLVIVGGIGLYFFARTGKLPAIAWVPSWIALMVASAINLWLSPRFAFLEGCGRIGDVARMRVHQSIIGYGLMWVALYCGAGLYAVPIIPTVGCIYSLAWLSRHGNFINDARKPVVDSTQQLSWREEILPLQWRISLSWASSYLIFNFFTPVVFARVGEAEAGRVGMALSIFGQITTIGMSWINAKAPQLSMLAAVRKFAEMKHVFQQALVRSAGAIAIAALGFLLCASQLGIYFPRVGMRLLPSSVMIYLAAVAVANGIVFSAATYMRSFKKEPMLIVSVATGLLSAAAVYAGSSYGTLRMLQLYAGVIVLICLPWTLLLLRHFYKMHSARLQDAAT